MLSSHCPKRKSGNGDVERLSVFINHAVKTLHRALKRSQNTKTIVPMGFSGFDERLLPHHTLTFYGFGHTVRISDQPFAVQQLYTKRVVIPNLNKIGEYKSTGEKTGSPIQIDGLNGYGNALCGLGIRVHKRSGMRIRVRKVLPRRYNRCTGFQSIHPHFLHRFLSKHLNAFNGTDLGLFRNFLHLRFLTPFLPILDFVLTK